MTKPSTLWVLAPLLGALACDKPSEAPKDSGPALPYRVEGPALVFDDVRVFDGERDLGIQDVVVEGETIRHVGEALLPEAPEAAGVQRIDGKAGAMTLMPGLIDAHVHVTSAADLQRAMVLGVTTELDQFMSERSMTMIKRQQAKGRLLDHADLRSAGVCATPPGGHGTEYGVEIPTVSSVGEVEGWTRDRVDAGVDWIKIIYDDGHAVGRPFAVLDEATLTALIEAAHAAGLRAVVHVSDLEAARTALSAGADGLAHLFFDAEADQAFLDLAVERQAFVTDTLAVMHMACADPHIVALLEDEALLELADPQRVIAMREGVRGMAGSGLDCGALDANLRRLHEAGVDLLASTDAPNFGLEHGLGMHVELALWVQAGLEPIAALRSATEVPARRFGLDDRGRVQAGLRADLVLVEGDPLADIAAARAVVGVWKAGHAVDLDARREAVAERRATLRAFQEAPPPPGSESGLVSDFEDDGDRDGLNARFGAWSPSTDQLMGGSSTVTLRRMKGAEGSMGALDMRGEVVQPEGAPAWAGASWVIQKPANLSSFTKLSFWARGAPGRYAVMLFTQHRGGMGATQSFELGDDPEAWTRVELEFADFGVELWDATALFVGATKAGPLELRIDDLRFD
ncbi:Secreted metal-dependent hydrolase, amidohydrolase family protein [Plesiocystis pacifica SIR-1]|uniref:Secreted metal-dependent hydrolase, amidohydrolase family protein n=1 Tax=Plesiocystis pacifica SIR-1 TaxID=391625 RepID=A6GC91_9BACT|nr:CIA30 family protein [Plesiocystis pacifica]EDM76540.1 Secreted metal-dependent hydrolase, amidohydrolase family protein [Plesiocystis pacifica SIR-1]